METKELTFDCIWCVEFGGDPFTYPLEELGGYDDELVGPVCEGCVDAAREDN